MIIKTLRLLSRKVNSFESFRIELFLEQGPSGLLFSHFHQQEFGLSSQNLILNFIEPGGNTTKSIYKILIIQFPVNPSNFSR